MAWPDWALGAWDTVQPWLERAAFWRGYEPQIENLLVSAAGIAVYTTLVFTFYNRISKRAVFAGKREPGFLEWLNRAVQRVFFFPLLSFAYFAIIALSLLVIAQQRDVGDVLLSAMAVVVAVRVMSFFNEGAANDLAKLLPLSLVGVLLVDPAYQQLDRIWPRVVELPEHLAVLTRYFALFIVLEGAMQLLRAGWQRARDRLALRRAAKPLRKDELLKTVETGHAGAPTRTLHVKEPTPKDGPAAEFELLK